ncbi:MAG: hypothetical protein AB8B59_03545 [Maribacter sp.]
MKRIYRFLLFMVFLNNVSVSAQNSQNLNLELIYNEWAFSESESHDNILVFADEDDFIFDGIKYNSSSNLRFTSYNDNFYLRYTKPRKMPARCGNHIPQYNKSKAEWRKGVWNVEQDGGYVFLTLEYFKAEKGKEYVRTKWGDYQILVITEDKMVLKKLSEESIH